MTTPNVNVPAQNATQPVADNKPSDKEINFRRQEQMFQKQLEQERQARLEAEKRAHDLSERQKQQSKHDDDDDDEPYVNSKKLEKTLSRYDSRAKEEMQTAIQQGVQAALEQERQQTWLKANPDFYDVMNHAETFANKDPDLAETILRMPEGFERQKLVYKNIKALGLHKPPEQKKSEIQDKIDANRRSPYYQPSGTASAPYNMTGDFSESGKKNAYDKMQQLKKQLRIG